jgi:hypothetical protein
MKAGRVRPSYLLLLGLEAQRTHGDLELLQGQAAGREREI